MPIILNIAVGLNILITLLLVIIYVTAPVALKLLVSMVVVSTVINSKRSASKKWNNILVESWFYYGLILISSYLIIDNLDNPFIWVFLYVGIALALLSFSSAGIYKIVLVNVTIVFIFLGATEWWYARQALNASSVQVDKKVKSSITGLSIKGKDIDVDSDLGYKLKKNISSREHRYNNNGDIFDATYTTNALGWRVTPYDEGVACAAYVNLGGSFTFGQGVNDDQTFSNRLEEKAAGMLHVYNISAPGYGAHQILSLLEDNRERIGVQEPYVMGGVFLAIADHIQRSAGLALWDQSGPRYLLENRKLTRLGQFNQGGYGRISYYLKKSYIVKTILTASLNNTDLDRQVMIILQIARKFKEKYKNELLVLYWDDVISKEQGYIIDRLNGLNVKVKRISEILPDFRKNISEYIIRGDSHPNTKTHELLAKYLSVKLSTCPSLPSSNNN